MKALLTMILLMSSSVFAAEIKITTQERAELKAQFCSYYEPGHYGSCNLVNGEDEKKNCLATAKIKVFDIPGVDARKARVMNVQFKKFKHVKNGYYNDSVCDAQLVKSGSKFKINGIYAGE